MHPRLQESESDDSMKLFSSGPAFRDWYKDYEMPGQEISQALDATPAPVTAAETTPVHDAPRAGAQEGAVPQPISHGLLRDALESTGIEVVNDPTGRFVSVQEDFELSVGLGREDTASVVFAQALGNRHVAADHVPDAMEWSNSMNGGRPPLTVAIRLGSDGSGQPQFTKAFDLQDGTTPLQLNEFLADFISYAAYACEDFAQNHAEWEGR